MFKKSLFIYLFIFTIISFAQNEERYTPEFSTAGFFSVENSPTKVYDFNVGWRFFKGKVQGAEKENFDDSKWELISVPHSPNLLPLEASGCNNYQGEAWYRKQFNFSPKEGKKTWLHFEAIMGKCKIWINGKKVTEHFGGFLPIHLEATTFLKAGKNIITVWCDNSNDHSYPPGKPQESLDFSYNGGIYRDVWMIETSNVYITNPNYEDKVASGGIFAWTQSIDLAKKEAVVNVRVHLRNASLKDEKLDVTAKLPQLNFTDVKTIDLKSNEDKTIDFTLKVKIEKDDLWHPNSPNLKNLIVEVNNKKNLIDSRRIRIGIRTFLLNKDGLFINGEPIDGKLMGVNRHQDFAHIGFALPNSLHYRDVLKLREAGVRIVRNAHYPQDPAFMDACDELGVFVIVNTPGWQYWSNAPIFVNRVYSDIKNMVRRDRNHASTFIWEPILNETGYSADFAINARKMILNEYPTPYCYSSCDSGARGQQDFDVVFRHPITTWSEHGGEKTALDNPQNYKNFKFNFDKDNRPSFTREFGDNVDDWNSHNSPSRVLKEWGERAQLIQAKHYTHPDYLYSSINMIYRAPRRHFGGALWHSFDHARGYHPDNFWGGIMDATRQPKISYYAFKAALLNPNTKIKNFKGGYFVHIAHEMTPFSPKDITCFSNCDEVRIKVLGKDMGTKTTRPAKDLPPEGVTFNNAYDYMAMKMLTRTYKYNQVSIIAEGLVGGKVVATHKVVPSYRRTGLSLTADLMRTSLIANGSDMVAIVAKLTDKQGTVKRLSSEHIEFYIEEGDAEIVDDGKINVNPQKASWGEAVVLVRAGTKPGKIVIAARVNRKGKQIFGSAKITLNSIATQIPLKQNEIPILKVKSPIYNSTREHKVSNEVKALNEELIKLQKELSDIKLREVERDQKSFEQGKPSN